MRDKRLFPACGFLLRFLHQPRLHLPVKESLALAAAGLGIPPAIRKGENAPVEQSFINVALRIARDFKKQRGKPEGGR